MPSLLVAILSAVALLIAYRTYGRWLGREIFRLSAETLCPSEKFRDDSDYCPTSPAVVFGHHFTSIAGTGPIVGPAIAILWGWVPALVWVLLGSIFIGAVHDFGALVVSLRNNGQTVGDIAGRVLNPRVRLVFLLVLFLALTIVLAIFGLVIAAVFRMYPSSIVPCILQIPIAVAIGCLIHQKGGRLLFPSLLALAAMYLTVIFGNDGFLSGINAFLASLPIATWVLILLLYSYVASVLPVWILLQPRDYINSLQLLSALGLVLVGLLAAALLGGAPTPDGLRPSLELVAPALNLSPTGAPPLFPFLFITVACGAVSGFHCLVSSGTSSKQLSRETDARFIGYGSMLTEGFLAVLVILACAAGLGLGVTNSAGDLLTGEAAWLHRYASWASADGLGAKVGAFVDGAANFLAALGIARATGLALMGVLVASFAATTLDTACRLQRYVIEELAGLAPRAPLLAPLRNKHGATLFAVVTALLIAMIPAPGQPLTWVGAGRGGQILWPLFGATNQLLGGMAFLVIAFHLRRRRRPLAFLLLPMLFMLLMPLWALFLQMFIGDGANPGWLQQKNHLLLAFGLATVLLECWMILEALRLWPSVAGVTEPPAPPPSHARHLLDVEGI